MIFRRRLVLLSTVLLLYRIWISMKMSSPPMAFVLDFDGTITTKDTISTLGDIGIAFQKTKGNDLTKSWEDLVKSYLEDYSKHVDSYKPAKEERKTLDEEIAYLRSLKEIELRSFGRVSASGVFRGISTAGWEKSARDVVSRGEVTIQEGFEDFVSLLVKRGGLWGIVSVNFSSQFIRGVLATTNVENADVEILANTADEDGVLHGPNETLLVTSDTKLTAMKGLLGDWKSKSTQRDSVSKVVYIGDSGTDIECLTAQGVVGIVLSKDGKSSLMETIKRIGMSVIHIDRYEEGHPSLYWARDFEEISNSPLLQLKSL